MKTPYLVAIADIRQSIQIISTITNLALIDNDYDEVRELLDVKNKLEAVEAQIFELFKKKNIKIESSFTSSKK